MKNKKLILWSMTIFILASLFLVVGTAMARGNLCGASEFTLTNGLLVKKDVYCDILRSWNWSISKLADQSNLTLATGQTFQVNYQVTASAQATDSFWVGGNIAVRNTTSASITINSVSDTLGAVTCAGISFPYQLDPGPNAVIHCTYTGGPTSAAPQNVVTVESSSGTASAVAPIDWSKATLTETDECAAISDTYAGAFGTVCVGQGTSFSFTYPRTIGPYAVCGDFTADNTASFTTNDTGATGSASKTVTVHVPCASGCSLTPGYWKTHSTFGPAPYDDTWAQVGENTIFYSSGKSYYQVLWTSPSGGNAYYILAHAYIAAKLNQLNGADFSAAQAAFNQATALFSNPANTPAAVGVLKGSARNTWINLATILDNYNNGLIGPGHCSE